MAVFEVNFYAQTLNRNVPLCVVLPTDKFDFLGMKKREEGKPYKTLYLLHCVTDNYINWLYNIRIRRWAADYDLVVVGGYGAMKNGLEYHKTFGAIAALSGAFIVDENVSVIPEHPHYVIETKEYKQSCLGTDLEAAGKGRLDIKILGFV